MSAYDVTRALVCVTLAGGALVGLAVRDRIRACVTFALYLAAAVVGRIFLLAWPEDFWTWDFVFWSDAVQLAVRAAIAFEISYKVFRPLPEGFKRMRLMLALVLVGMVVAFVLNPPQATNTFEATLVLQQVTYGVTFLFVAFLVVTWCYGVPVDPLHRDITCGFTLLNAVLAFTSAFSQFDPAYEWGRDLIVKTTYPLLLAAWCVSAWRRDEPSRLSPETMRILQRWRVR